MITSHLQLAALFKSWSRRFGHHISNHPIVWFLRTLLLIGMAITAIGVFLDTRGEMIQPEQKSFVGVVILFLECWLTTSLVYETLYRYKDYQLLTRLPVEAKTLFWYILLQIMLRVFIIVCCVTVIDLLLGTSVNIIWMHLRGILSTMAFSLPLLILAGYGNVSHGLAWFRRIISSGLIPEVAFLYYMPGIAFITAIIPEIIFHERFPLLLTLYSISLFIVAIIISFLFYMRKFLSIRVYTEDAWLQYNIRLGVGEGGPIFGQWLSKYLPTRVAAAYMALLRTIRRRYAPAYYMMAWAPAALLLMFWLERDWFDEYATVLTCLYIAFNLLYLHRGAWLPKMMRFDRWPISRWEIVLARLTLTGWLHFAGAVVFAAILLIGSNFLGPAIIGGTLLACFCVSLLSLS